jgi:hypothetical protein
MIAFFKGKAVSQADTLLCEGEMFSLKDISAIIREYKIKPQSKKKKGK